MDTPGVRQVPEGSREQWKMEETACKIICGALTTVAVKGQTMMMMMTMMMVTMMTMMMMMMMMKTYKTEQPIFYVELGCLNVEQKE